MWTLSRQVPVAPWQWLNRCLGGDRRPLHFRIMASLRASGRPVPNYDVWIADHAMEIGADFVSAISHFGPISGPHDVIQLS